MTANFETYPDFLKKSPKQPREKKLDIIFLYSSENGSDPAQTLLQIIQKYAHKFITVQAFACPKKEILEEQWKSLKSKEPQTETFLNTNLIEVKERNSTFQLKDGPFDPRVIEECVASARTLVVILSKDFLNLASAGYGMAVAVENGVRIVLVHDPATCYFPGESEQPQFLKDADVFHDKAITYMKQYKDVCARELLKKVSKTPHKSYDVTIIYHHVVVNPLNTITNIFQGAKLGFLQFPSQRFEPIAKDFMQPYERKPWDAISVRNMIASSRAVMIYLREEMAMDENIAHLNTALQLIQLFGTRVYLLYDDSHITTTMASLETRLNNKIRRSGLLQRPNVVINIEDNLRSEAVKNVLKIERSFNNCNGVETETRGFLSHKRSSAQGLAGRLYQGLRADYRIFLDSEADFDLHDLKEIVRQTRLFIFILSEGIFESYWCLQELRSAVENQKRILILKDSKFVIPKTFPKELEDIQNIINNSKSIEYMAEFYEHCLVQIRAELGPPDSAIQFIKNVLLKEDRNLLKCLEEGSLEGVGWVLKFPEFLNNKVALPDFLDALRQYYNVPLDRVVGLQLIDNYKTDDVQLKYALGFCNRIRTLELRNCRGITDTGLLYVSIHAPALHVISIEGCFRITDKGIKRILKKCAGSLTSLNLSNCPRVTNRSLSRLTKAKDTLWELNLSKLDVITESAFAWMNKDTKIKNLILDGCKLIDDAAVKFFSACTSLEILSMNGCHKITDKAVEMLADNCPGIHTLSLAECTHLTGASLKSLTKFSKLQKLNLSSCVGIEETAFKVFPRTITHLDLSRTYITDNSLTQIASQCPQLQEVFLNYCQVSKSFTALAEKCHEILILHATNTKIGNAEVAALFSQLPRLACLILSDCPNINDEAFASVDTTPLQILELDNCKIKDGALVNIAKLCHLTNLSLQGAGDITDNGLQNLKSLKELRFLNLKGLPLITTKSLKFLAAEIPKLLTIDLTDCKALVDIGLKDVSKGLGRTVKELTLAGTGITDISVDYLTSDVNPTRVDLSNCRISDESVRFISQGFPNVSRLVLKSCPLLTDSALLYLGEKLTNLKYLDISDCTLISTAGVRAVVEKLRELNYFYAKGCKKISGDGMKLVTANSLLKELVLSGNLFSDSGVKKTIKGCFKLSTFELHDAAQITGKSLLFIATGSPSLERLVLTGCAAMTASAELVALVDQCPLLRHLELTGCAEITAEALTKISSKLPHLRHLSLSSQVDIHEDITEQLLSGLSNLESLNLSGFRVTDAVAGSFPVTLRSLTLKSCNRFSDVGLGKLGARCPLLQQLVLIGCATTADGINRLKKTCRHLL